jgi:hypothetical protein
MCSTKLLRILSSERMHFFCLLNRSRCRFASPAELQHWLLSLSQQE